MIAHVIGTVAEKFNGAVIVDVAGVGYEVLTALTDFDNASLNSQAKFYTYHHVREQAEELYGFSTLAAKKFLRCLSQCRASVQRRLSQS